MHRDAVVVGSGPNGLVAANLLADAGWSVLVLEAADQPGGAVRTGEVTSPGFRNDLFSAFYPLAMVSPPMRRLRLEDHGLAWKQPPVVFAHPVPDGVGAVVSVDPERTAAGLEAAAPGDGQAYLDFCESFARAGRPMLEALLSPLPPLRPGLRLAARAGAGGLFDLARLAVLPVRRFVEERFQSEAAKLLFAGCALHADIPPESAGSGLFGWILAGLAQEVGWPVPAGGAGELSGALVRRLESAGGTVRCGVRVAEVVVRGGRAVAVRASDGQEYQAGRAVLADVDAANLYGALLPPELVPPAVRAAMGRFERSPGTVKLDWALDRPIPWTSGVGVGAGVVHVAHSLDELTRSSAQLATRAVPEDPFLILGQMTTADPSRSPAGTESAWAYTHVPNGCAHDPLGELKGDWGPDDLQRFADRIEHRVERLAPGFRDRVLSRRVVGPRELQSANANLVGGDIGGGTSQLHQQLVFRPSARSFGPHTPIRGLYLASASAHPGPGGHGACGANAAHAALARERRRKLVVGFGLGAGVAAAGRTIHRRG